MSLFGPLGASASGIDAAQTWIDAIAGNVANSNDVASVGQSVYQEQEPILTPTGATGPGQIGDGVAVSGVALGSAAGTVESDPGSVLANSQGLVRVPNVDLAQQMTNLIQAQDTYQANTAALQRAITAYQSALTLGS
ncbi:MAG TPA: flagellar basal body rod C-terminal domain-containing protein [Acidimicrobiales bacterium]|nr:flagellar basal body rod C-terminal domain-containing protein [Acidimicrobiales bacterium]